MEPMLRFKADDGSDFPDWEEMTLGELFYISAGGDIDKNNCAVKQSKDYPYPIYANALVNGGLYGYTNYYKIDGDTFTVTGRGDVGHAVARHCKYVPIVRLLVCRPNMDDDVDFFAEQINYTRIFTESTGVPQLTAPQLSKTKVKRPSLPEQRKIADLLSAVDDVIAAQEAEVAAWEKRKKGVMQKLFSQEVRFKADDGSDFPDWEEKALGDLGHFVRGLSYDKTQVLDEGSDASGTAVLRSNNINSDGTLNYRDDVQLVSKEPSSEQRLCENDVVICMANGSNRLVGKAARYDGGYDAGQITVGAFCGIFRTNSPLVPWWFQSDDYKSFLHLSRQGGNGALANLKGRDIEAISLLFPSSSTEQREIADCLASLDDVIAKAKDELDAWRELKKGLLQQMFV